MDGKHQPPSSPSMRSSARSITDPASSLPPTRSPSPELPVTREISPTPEEIMASARKDKGKGLARWGLKPAGMSSAVSKSAQTVSKAVKGASKNVKGALKQAISPSSSEEEIVVRKKGASKRRARASTIGDRPKPAPVIQAAVKYNEEGWSDVAGNPATMLYQRVANERGKSSFDGLSSKDRTAHLKWREKIKDLDANVLFNDNDLLTVHRTTCEKDELPSVRSHQYVSYYVVLSAPAHCTDRQNRAK